MAGGARVNRLLLGLVAANCLMGGLALEGLAGLAVSPGVLAAARVPDFMPVLLDGIRLAGVAALAGAVIGLAAGACLRRAGAWARLVLAACVLVLFVPAPALLGLPESVADLENAGGFGSAVARAAALMLLATSWAWGGVDPALRRAALAAGASPGQAWRHVVLAPLGRPVVLGLVAGFLAALAQTRAGGLAVAGVMAGEAWHLAAGLLLAAFGVVALGVAVRRGAGRDRLAGA